MVSLVCLGPAHTKQHFILLLFLLYHIWLEEALVTNTFIVSSHLFCTDCTKASICSLADWPRRDMRSPALLSCTEKQDVTYPPVAIVISFHDFNNCSYCHQGQGSYYMLLAIFLFPFSYRQPFVIYVHSHPLYAQSLDVRMRNLLSWV